MEMTRNAVYSATLCSCQTAIYFEILCCCLFQAATLKGPATPKGQVAAANISTKSKPDYKFHTLGSSTRVVALVIEEKGFKTAKAIKEKQLQPTSQTNLDQTTCFMW